MQEQEKDLETTYNQYETYDDNYVDERLERRVVRKLDLFTLPVVMCLYLVSFLDRASLGNMKIAGLPEEIGLQGSDFNVATSLFYVTYIIFDVPMTVLVKRYGPSIVLPTYAIAWSFVAVFSGFIENYAGLLAVRLMLGITEAGLFPGLNFYISLLYKRNEISKRICCIFISLALSGAIGGLLAFAILKMDGLGGKSGWRWLYIIEGIASFVMGVASYFLLPDSPETAYFLNEEERRYAKMRIDREHMYKADGEAMQWRDIKEALLSVNVWVSGFIQLGANTYLFGFSIFLPTIIENMQFTAVQAQCLTIPVFVTGAVCYFAVSVFADKYQKRFIFMVAGVLVTFIGYSVLLGSQTKGILFMATFFVAAGGYIVPGMNITWLNVNTAGPYKRAAAIGLNQSIGNFGGVISGQIYRNQDKPRYILGHAVSIGGAGFALVGTFILFGVFQYKNKQKQKRLAEIDTVSDGRGDESAKFVYVM